MKTMKSTRQFDFMEFYMLYPRLTVLVGSRLNGRDNLMPASWHTPLSGDPPLYGVVISPKRATYRAIQETGGFTVNFVPLEMAELSEKTGFCSGADTDKFKAFGIEKAQALLDVGPILRGAYAALECLLEDTFSAGDHAIMVGLVDAVHWDESFAERYQDQNVIARSARPMFYAGRGIYATWDPSSLIRLRD
ncbi:MAG: flavin reductase family protein [candidate division WOR-3 bacterium]